MLRRLLLLGALACSLGVTAARDYDANSYYALKIHPHTSPDDVAAHLGLRNEGPLKALNDHYVFSAPKHDHDIVQDSLQRRKRSLGPHVLDGVQFAEKQQARQRLVKRSVIPPRSPQDDPNAFSARADVARQLEIVDPEFNGQWHLYNTREVGNDLNVTSVWLDGITGKGVTVCIIDDGLDMDSLDLKPNYFAKGSYDFNEGVDEPKPRLSDDQHGTRCAGEVAASKNDVCGVGVAYNARISGLRILSKPISDIDEAESIGYMNQDNDIYSCSWGPPDDGRTMDAPGTLIQQAMLKAIQEGRAGKGNIYVYAAGNGASSDDNCNYDGYTNSIYSISVGAIDRKDKHPYYSEKCSAQLVVTYSSGSGDAIHTTDVGLDKCTKIHGGTSAAGPLAAGVYALVLSARPDLTWRDVQWLTVMNAVSFRDPAIENDWQKTPLGVEFSHQFGYGKLDAGRIVEAAKTWKNVKPQAWYFSPWIHVKHEIPQGDQGLHSTFTVTKEMIQEANLERIEHVVVTMNAVHQQRGELGVELVSPSGVRSFLAPPRRFDTMAAGYVDWNFMSVAHFGEDGVGEWTVIVRDRTVDEKTGSLTDWRLKLFGESIDAVKAGLLPMPNEHDDDDHDVVYSTTAAVSTAPVTPITSTPLPDGSDHPTRPAIPKPTDADATPTPASPTGTTAPAQTTNPNHDNFLPPIFPTFGVSKSTQIWIYGAMAIIIIFITGLLIYFYVQRRKRLAANPREGYEFEMLNDEEEEMLGAGRTGRRRAGELYDAFAGESDEDSLFSDDEDDARRRRDDGSERGSGEQMREK
jgi:kexin